MRLLSAPTSPDEDAFSFIASMNFAVPLRAMVPSESTSSSLVMPMPVSARARVRVSLESDAGETPQLTFDYERLGVLVALDANAQVARRRQSVLVRHAARSSRR